MTIHTFASKLAESGLSHRDAARLRLRLLRPRQTARLAPHYREAAALHIPYFDPFTGKRIDFHRVRYLQPLSSFATGRKYDNPAKVAPHAYFPRGPHWPKILKDSRHLLTVTEGELKAASAVKHQILCIGLGGVWSWKSRKLGMDFLPELEAIHWKDRRVELCFDSDIQSKPEVRAALIALTRELAARGAQIKTVLLPSDSEAEKVGLDDYLVAHGATSYIALPRLDIDPAEEVRRQLMQRFVYVRQMDHVVDLVDEATFRSRQHFTNATAKIKLMNGSDKPTTFAKEWYGAPEALHLPTYVFRPDLSQRLIPEVGINLYRGLAVEPRRGSVDPMLKVIDSIVGRRPEIRRWLLQWLAAPLVQPGLKMSTCVYVFSPQQGVGKTAIGEVMLDIYGRGRHGVDLDEEDFFGSWNDWMEKGLFGLADELSFDGSKKSRSIFKRRITGEAVILSGKYRDRVTIANRCNFYLTGNNPGGLPLESGENRRVLVVQAQKAVGTHYLETTFDRWRHHENGPSHWLHYLLHQVPLDDFHPRRKAPTTDEEKLAILSSGTQLEVWLTDNLDRKPLSQCDIWTARQVLAIYQMDTLDTRSSVTVMNRALAAKHLSHLKPTVVNGSLEQSLWALRNAKHWIASRPDGIRKEWERGHAGA